MIQIDDWNGWLSCWSCFHYAYPILPRKLLVKCGQFSMAVALILIFVGLYLYNHIFCFSPIFVRVKSLKFLFVGATSCPLRFPHLLVALPGNQFLQPRHFANLCAPWLRQMPWKCQVLTEVSRGNVPKKMELRARGKLMGTSPFRNLEIYIEIYGKSQFLIGMCWSMLIIYNWAILHSYVQLPEGRDGKSMSTSSRNRVSCSVIFSYLLVDVQIQEKQIAGRKLSMIGS